MDQVNLPIETERAITKLDKIDLRSEISSGWGSTTGGKALTRQYHERLTAGVAAALLGTRKGQRGEAEASLVALVRGLSPSVIALSCVQTVLHSIGMRETLRDTLIRLGTNIANECWAAKLIEVNTPLAIRIAREARMLSSATERRFKSAEKAVARAAGKLGKQAANGRVYTDEERATAKSLIGFRDREWTRPSLMVAGGWLWNIISTSLPEVFERAQVPGTTEHQITITEAGWAIVDDALDHAVTTNPVLWPSAEKPKDWEGFTGGASNDARINGVITVLRTNHRDTQAAVKHAIKAGTMQPALDALNVLQSTAFKINTKVLDVIKECSGFKVDVKGLVPEDLKVDEKPNAFAWGAMTEAQQRLWKTQRGEKRRTNSGYLCDRVLYALDMKIAESLSGLDAFYTPMNLDWRGRVYGLSHFNFQREDRVRALFLFSEGLPIGEEGLRWLKIHTANTGDFGKISKRPLEERVQWCDTYRQQIMNIALEPLVHTEWMQADKPFLHLAACFELSAALEQGSSYVTHLPTSYDGSCSGLQHLAAMTRAMEGSMVNLTPSKLPQDVYQQVADDTCEQIKLDLTCTPEGIIASAEAAKKRPPTHEGSVKQANDIRAMAQLFLDYDGNWRNLVKRNVMTYSYSSRKFGMASQQQVDLIEPLAREVLEGKRKEHPFVGFEYGPYSKEGVQQPSKAARYIAGRVFEAIEKRITKPAEAMKFLQSIAKAMAHEGKPVCWTTPVGLPWINRYHEPDTTTVKLYLIDSGVKERVRFNVAVGSKKEIDKAKAANGVAPNFVHALDASHLLLVANAALAGGIRSVATVHDSFGCLAPQATRFNAIIREQFELMYSKHDVLAEILERACADLTPANRNRLPIVPERGSLDLKEILNADFAFA
jgi:DNA-directed RNA polymerase